MYCLQMRMLKPFPSCNCGPTQEVSEAEYKAAQASCTWTPYLARSAAQHSPPSPAPTTTTSVECERASGAVGSALLGLLSGAATAGAADALAGLARGLLLHLHPTIITLPFCCAVHAQVTLHGVITFCSVASSAVGILRRGCCRKGSSLSCLNSLTTDISLLVLDRWHLAATLSWWAVPATLQAVEYVLPSA